MQIYADATDAPPRAPVEDVIDLTMTPRPETSAAAGKRARDAAGMGLEQFYAKCKRVLKRQRVESEGEEEPMDEGGGSTELVPYEEFADAAPLEPVSLGFVLSSMGYVCSPVAVCTEPALRVRAMAAAVVALGSRVTTLGRVMRGEEGVAIDVANAFVGALSESTGISRSEALACTTSFGRVFDQFMVRSESFLRDVEIRVARDIKTFDDLSLIHI